MFCSDKAPQHHLSASRALARRSYRLTRRPERDKDLTRLPAEQIPSFANKGCSHDGLRTSRDRDQASDFHQSGVPRPSPEAGHPGAGTISRLRYTRATVGVDEVSTAPSRHISDSIPRNAEPSEKCSPAVEYQARSRRYTAINHACRQRQRRVHALCARGIRD